MTRCSSICRCGKRCIDEEPDIYHMHYTRGAPHIWRDKFALCGKNFETSKICKFSLFLNSDWTGDKYIHHCKLNWHHEGKHICRCGSEKLLNETVEAET